MIRSSVDLPQPEGPTIATNCPCLMLTVMFSSTRSRPLPRTNSLETDLSSSRATGPRAPNHRYASSSVVHSETFGGIVVYRPPNQPVQAHYYQNHRQEAKQDHGAVARFIG